jgi:hypothetical protein
MRLECVLDASWMRIMTETRPTHNRNIKLLVEKVGGLFIYTVTSYRFLHDDRRFAQERLDLIISGDTCFLSPEKKLDQIYTTVLAYPFDGPYDEQENTDVRHLFQHTVGSIVVLFDRMSLTTLSELFNIPMTEIKRTLNNLHSVLDVPVDNDDFIRPLHPSFRDFLLNANRCSSLSFLVDKNEAHHRLF